MQLIQKIGILFCVAILFFSCSEEKKVFVNTPIDQLIKKLDTKKTFSIILYDMDIEEGSSADVYKHKYKVITSKEEKTSEDTGSSVFRFASNETNNDNIFRFVDNDNDSTTEELPEQDSSTSEVVEQDVAATDVEEEIGEWVVVEKDFFEHHINNMGMEVASKDAEGKVNKVPAPPGYGTHVGNDKYGKWQTNSSGTSFWVFYGQYAMMRTMFGYHSPIYRNNYSSYRSNYHGKQSYYGTKTGSTNAYGTGSANARTQNPSVANKSSSFKSKVNSIKSRSTSTRSSGRSSSSGRGRSGGGGGK
jgi:hypothetical protein